MKKVVSAVNGHIGVFKNGEMSDSGVALSDLAEKSYVDSKITEEVSKTQHLTKKIVDKAPELSEAQENVIYLVKDETATGKDKYIEYMLIKGEVVATGDTSVDLSDYDKSDVVDQKIATAKEQAVSDAIKTAASDATTKANKALNDAKSYTDSEIGKVSQKVTANEEAITELNKSVSTMESTVNQHGDRITSLETKVNNIDTATEQDIRALFE